MQLHGILILAELWRFKQAGVRWDFCSLRESFGFSAPDGPLPRIHNRHVFKKDDVFRCARSCEP